MPNIQDAKILIIATNGFEQSELEVPRDKLREAGATVTIATPDGEDINGWDDGNWGDKAKADMKIADASIADFDGLVLPGGQINPDILRTQDDAVALIKSFYDAGKTIAAICHAPWLLVEADIIRDRAVTSYPSIRKDVENAGGKWEDSEVVVDQAIITSRNPGDLDAFVSKIIEEIEEGRHQRDAA